MLPSSAQASRHLRDWVTWDSLPAAVQRAAAEGFNGTVIARRNGAETLRTAVGIADPTSRRFTALNSVYSIGSQPMDFTKTAVLLLAQRGRLKLDDSITRFIDDVPADKRGITVRQLLSGGSGLVDFYHDEAKDWNADLSWIPRDEAVRRMMASTLRFTRDRRALRRMPRTTFRGVRGKGERPDLRDFLRRSCSSAGNDTHWLLREHSDWLIAFATGGGPALWVFPASPNWGPTSWLVMGSGGMVSTSRTGRIHRAREGTILSGEWARCSRAVQRVRWTERGYSFFMS